MPVRRAANWLSDHAFLTLVMVVGLFTTVIAWPIYLQARSNENLAQATAELATQNEQTLERVQTEEAARAQAVIDACILAASRVGRTFDELFDFMRDDRPSTPRLDQAEAIADRNLDPQTFCHPVIDPVPVESTTATTNP